MVFLGTMSFVREVDEVEANLGSGSVSAQFEEKGSVLVALDAVPISDATADGKVNKWIKNTLVWFPRSRRTLVLDELLPAAFSVSSAATELMPQAAPVVPAAAAVVCGPDPARLPFDATVGVAATDIEPAGGPNPAWLERWVNFEEGLAIDSKEWEWVSMEDEEEKEEKEEKRMNSEASLLEKEHVTDLVADAVDLCIWRGGRVGASD